MSLPSPPFLPPLSRKNSPLLSRRSSVNEEKSQPSALSSALLHHNSQPSPLYAPKPTNSEGRRTPRQHRTPPLRQQPKISVPLPQSLTLKPKQQPIKAELLTGAHSHTHAAPSYVSIAQLQSQKPAPTTVEESYPPPDTRWERSVVADSGLFTLSNTFARRTVESILNDSRKREENKEQLSSTSLTSLSLYAPPVTHSLLSSSSSTIAAGQARPSMADDAATIASLMRQVAVLESKCQRQHEELIAKETQLVTLQSELTDATAQVERSQVAEAQLRDMTQFLADYGLVWKGNDEAGQPVQAITPVAASHPRSISHDSHPAQHQSQSSPSITSIDGHEIDIERFITSCNRLNESFNQAVKMRVVNVNGVTKFQSPPSLTLTLYSDGLYINSHFRHWSDPSVRMFVCDVNDGYFPSELKGVHPDGIALTVINDSEQCYSERRTRTAQQSRMERLVSSGDDIRNRWSTVRIVDNDISSDMRKQSPSQSLSTSMSVRTGVAAFHVRCQNVSQSFLLMLRVNQSLLQLTQAIQRELLPYYHGRAIQLRWSMIQPRAILTVTSTIDTSQSDSNGIVCPKCVSIDASLSSLGLTHQCCVYLHER